MSWKTLQETQPNAAKILTNSFKKDRLAHAYLFEGNKGAGKKQAAFTLAKSYFCGSPDGVEPCGRCSDCRRIASGNHPDVHFIAPDGLSIKKEQVTSLIREFSYRGLESKRKVYIVDDADKMTTQAANSLLKFLEEPGEMTIAVLLTEQAHRMLSTIMSRCQVVSFSVLSPKHLEEQLTFEQQVPEHMKKMAVSLTNDFNQAREICENQWFAQARNIVIQLTEELRIRPYGALVFLQEKWNPHFQEKEDLMRALDLLLLWYRDLLCFQLEQNEKLVFIDQREVLEKQVLHSSQKRVIRQMSAILEAKRRLEAYVNPQFVMEQLVMRLQEG